MNRVRFSPSLPSIREENEIEEAERLLPLIQQCTKAATDVNILACFLTQNRALAAKIDKPRLIIPKIHKPVNLTDQNIESFNKAQETIRPILVGPNLLLFAGSKDRKLHSGTFKTPLFAVNMETAELQVVGFMRKKVWEERVRKHSQFQPLSEQKIKKAIECNWNEKKSSLFREAALMRRLQSHIPEIVQFHSLYVREVECGIVMEACLEGDLLDRMEGRSQTLSPIQKDQIARDIAKGVSKLHEQGVLHCDLKLENIFLTSDFRGKVGDLGLARKCNEPPCSAMIGSPRYISPERCKGHFLELGKDRNHAIKPTTGSDLWALGTILFGLFTGEFLIQGNLKTPPQESYQTIAELSQQSLDEKIEKAVPAAYQALVKGLLQVDPNKRISGAEAVALLEQIPRPVENSVSSDDSKVS